MTVAVEVQDFIVTQLLKGRKQSIGVDESLISSGVLDSVSWLQLVNFIEKQYGITVEDDELLPETFESVDAISQFVERKQAGLSRRR